MLPQIGEELGNINYGGIKSTLYWVPDKAVTIEVMDIGSGSLLVRGAKHYFISEFVRQDEHSNLEQVGHLSEVLRDSWKSFELSMLYINRLSSAMSETDKKQLKEKIEQKRSQIKTFELQQVSVRNDAQRGLASSDDINLWQRKIDDLYKEVHKDEEQLEHLEQIEREYKNKGTAATFIIKRQTMIRECAAAELPHNVDEIIVELVSESRTVKNMANKGLSISLEELKVPHVAWLSESLGIHDPRILETFVEKYPRLKAVKDSLEKMFTRRWASDAVVGHRKYTASAAHAQAVASLLKKARGSDKEYYFDSTDLKSIPKHNENLRQGVLGLVVDGYMEMTTLPLYIDYDVPTNYAFLGTSRYGKTIGASVFAESALGQGIPVLVIDPTGSWTGFLDKCDDASLTRLYRDFQMSEPTGYRGRIFTVGSDAGLPLSANLLVPHPPRNDDKYTNELQMAAIETSNIMGKMCALSDKEKSEISNLLAESWARGKHLKLDELLGSVRGTLAVNLQKLHAYHFLFEGKPIDDVTKLWKNDMITIVNLHHLAQDQRMWAAYYILRRIVEHFDREEGEEKKTTLIVIVEEVHQFEKEAIRILDKATRELLKRGVRVVLITHNLVDLEGIRGNVTARFYFRQENDREVEKIVESVGTSAKDVLRNLPRGMAIADLPDYQPFLVQFRPPFHRMKELTEAETAKAMAIWREHKIVYEKKAGVEVSDEDIFLDAIRKYYKEYKEHPHLREMIRTLKWGAEKATRIKNKLIEQGLIKEIKEGKKKLLLPAKA